MPSVHRVQVPALAFLLAIAPGQRPADAADANAEAVDGHVDRARAFSLTSPPDGVTVALGGPGVDLPWLVSPAVRGSGGVQGLWTLHDQPQVLVRMGLGWASVQTDRSAPPVQFMQPPPWNLDGSALAWRHDGGEWYASVQRRQWGPGWTGSLILDGAAAPLPAIGWRRPLPLASASPWLRWMGPWSADVFAGRLAGHDQPERPTLFGMRLQLQPFDTLQLGLSRTMQWGGRGRQEDAKALLRSLLGQDNAGTSGVTAENQPGNQLGGFDWRWQFAEQREAGAWRSAAFYGQMIGEDENGYLPSAYIAQFGLAGRWQIGPAAVDGFVEWTDLIADHVDGGHRPPGITYNSGVYRRGYTHQGLPLGHPAGGDVTLASVGLVVQAAGTELAVVASHGEALATAQRFAAGPFSGLNARLQHTIDTRQQLGAGLWWWRDAADRQLALQAWWRWNH